MNKQTLSISGLGGKVMKRKGAVLASALASILSFGTAYAATLNMSTQKSTISNKAEAGAGTVLKLWLQDDAGNMATAGFDYTVKVDSKTDTVIADFSFMMPMGTMSTILTVGGAGTPDVAVAGQGSTMLQATATTTTAGSLTSNEIPLAVVADYMTASFTNLKDGTNVGQYVDISVTNGASALDAKATASVTHVVDDKVVDTIPAALVANNQGTLTLAFQEPTGNLNTGEYYVVKSEGLGDALIAGVGEATKADLVVPTMPSMAGNSNIAGGAGKQDGTFVNLFDGKASFGPNDNLNVMMSIKVDPKDVGKPADKIIVAAFADIYNTFGTLISDDMLLAWCLAPSRTTFTTWDWDKKLTPSDTKDDEVSPYETGKILTSEEAFHIWSGPLPFPGVFFFFAGYRLADGTIVFNDKEIGQLIITP